MKMEFRDKFFVKGEMFTQQIFFSTQQEDTKSTNGYEN